MAHAGQEIEGFGGMRLTLLRTAAETGGALLEMEARYAGDGGMPPEHLHPSQTETFEVLEGAMATIIGEAERTYAAGERFEVPAGVPHRMAAQGPTRVRWEVRPALRTAEAFERLYDPGPRGAAADFEAFLSEFAPEIRLTGR